MSQTVTEISKESGKRHTYPSGLALDPPFTIAELRAAIPPHCFERSLIKSFSYLFMDLTLITVTGTLAYLFLLNNPALPLWATILGWTAYVCMQGLFMTGLWVLAHECGHRAFAESNFINDTVGLIFHSALLVPYHSWRISHASHHAYTGHMEKDEVHLPNTFSQVKDKLPWKFDQVISSMLKHFLLGWPAYLIANASSNRSYKIEHKGKRVNHFSPSSPLFKPKHRNLIILSDVALVVALAILGYLTYTHGPKTVLLLYFLPYLNVNMWLVLITKLQHTDMDIPRYSPSEWTWLKGQLTTMDRSFGWFIDMVLHHIQDTHVCHHLFPRLPHYHAQEATEHLIKKLGPYYRRNEDNVIKQTWQCFNECVFVEDNAEIYWFNDNSKAKSS